MKLVIIFLLMGIMACRGRNEAILNEERKPAGIDLKDTPTTSVFDKEVPLQRENVIIIVAKPDTGTPTFENEPYLKDFKDKMLQLFASKKNIFLATYFDISHIGPLKRVFAIKQIQKKSAALVSTHCDSESVANKQQCRDDIEMHFPMVIDYDGQMYKALHITPQIGTIGIRMIQKGKNVRIAPLKSISGAEDAELVVNELKMLESN
jgi:hypothetical protein